MPWIFGALAASVAAVLGGAALGRPEVSAIATASFALAMVVVAWSVNYPFWRLDRIGPIEHAPLVTARRNARLMAITYAWGAIAMQATYTIAGLRWYHAPQYGLAMALLAALLFLYAVAVGRDGSRLRQPQYLSAALQLAAVQGVAALAAVLYLIGTGKLLRLRPDWAANHIFLAGGLAIASLSGIAAITQYKARMADAAPRTVVRR